ncbi:hypothetical protein FRC0150_01388 [Corynebacterium diphtheriae]|nr:hypothetical protein FRC0101_01347 [Corynebacterium diphtheriae]CAB0751966.1 hypothetical protein FRC0114_01341 [Corynebacterium diphtheriae]CAB0752333.1 hypothetical protein FRC0150_01388 [Corynebacterium diphtheriae]
MKTAGVTDDVDTLIADTLTREESGSTALPKALRFRIAERQP